MKSLFPEARKVAGIPLQPCLLLNGYTLVAKGVEVIDARYLQHENKMYGHVWPLQGTFVPVCLGTVDLLKPYHFDNGVYAHFYYSVIAVGPACERWTTSRRMLSTRSLWHSADFISTKSCIMMQSYTTSYRSVQWAIHAGRLGAGEDSYPTTSWIPSTVTAKTERANG